MWAGKYNMKGNLEQDDGFVFFGEFWGGGIYIYRPGATKCRVGVRYRWLPGIGFLNQINHLPVITTY